MNNSMVAHLWAHEQEESASGSNFFFEGTSIYSYGHHFEVGRIVKNKQGKIEYIQKCKCGAVTISFDNGASNSMFWETFEKLDLDAGDATWLHQSCCCNHCVNHWGIDLCECGSGARVGECECGSQKAHDTLGIKYDSFGAILKNFG